jgi:hypothetical protein
MQQQEAQFDTVAQQSIVAPSGSAAKSALVPLSDELLELVAGGAGTMGPHDNW